MPKQISYLQISRAVALIKVRAAIQNANFWDALYS